MVLASLSGQLRILLIESDRDSIDLIEDLFLAIERETDFSITCHQSLSLIQAKLYLKHPEKIDIILLDLFLQDSQGIETLKTLKKWSYDLPIIVLGPTGTEKLYCQVLEFGAQDYLIKDCIGSQLLIRSSIYAIERQKTQNALRQSEEKYRFVIDSIREIIFQIDLSGNWLFLNSAWTNITGFPVAETLGKPAVAYIHPRDIDRHQQEFVALRSGQKEKIAYKLKFCCTEKKRYCYLKITASSLVSSSGEIIGISGTCEDLTDYQAQQDRLNKLTSQLDRLAQNIPGTIFQLCQSKLGDRSFSYLSRGFQSLFEVMPPPIPTNPEMFLMFLESKERDRFLKTLEKSAKTLKPWELEFCIDTPSGQKKWLKGISQPEKQKNGEILWDGVIIDITPLKQTENALVQQQELLFKIIQTSPNVWYFYDLKTQQYIYLNQSLRKILGYSSEEFYERYLHIQLTHPDDIKPLEIYFEQFASGRDGETFTIEYRMHHKHRSWRWFLSRDLIFSRSADGEPQIILGTMTDISELKEIEEKLQTNQDRLQLALENSELGLWDWNLVTGAVIYSERWKQLIGYRDEEIAGNFATFEQLVYPEDLPKVLKKVENYLQSDTTNRTVQADFRMQTKAGEWKWFVSQGKVTAWDKDGNPLQMIGTTKDIHDRKQTELELHLLLAAARAINGACNFQDAIAIILPLFCQTIGWDVAEAWIPIEGGKKLQYVRGGYASKPELQEFIDRSRAIDLIPSIGFAGKIYHSQKLEWIEDVCHPSEKNFYRREMAEKVGLRACFGIPILKNKRVLAILIFLKTIPLICDLHLVDVINAVAAQLGEFMQRKRIEERSLKKTRQLREMLHQLKRSQARAIHNEKMTALGQLVAGFAHEINNPISFIYGNIAPALNYAEELLALVHLYQKHYPHPVVEVEEAIAALDLEFMEADFLKLLESMQTGATRIQNLVKSLRNFSRLDESDRKDADLCEGLNNTSILLQHRLNPQSDRPEIQIVKNFVALPKIECYPGYLNQVFMNLMSNAIDALEEKWFQGVKFTPTLTLTTEVGRHRDRQQSYIRIHIADNGAGIPQHLQLRIFEPFFTTKSIGKGTGLGLTTSHDIIVEKHGGRLYCASTVGEGTEFAIEIPFQ
ncbi:MAG: PAS domain-containing protein [Cyanobacteria bacterium SBLK]|nr:PAS domain-containing protein [Cyanobacteria bacterium SBLK]